MGTAAETVRMAVSFEHELLPRQCPFVYYPETGVSGCVRCKKVAGHELQGDKKHTHSWRENAVEIPEHKWRTRRVTPEEKLEQENNILRLVIHARERELQARAREAKPSTSGEALVGSAGIGFFAGWMLSRALRKPKEA